MNRRSLIVRTAVVSLGMLVPPGAVAQAADLKVLTSVALTSVLDELAPLFEKTTGTKLAISYGLAADLKKRVLDGETADVIMPTRPMMEDLQKQNRFTANGLVNIAGTPVAVAARDGAPKPDIGSVDAFNALRVDSRSEYCRARKLARGADRPTALTETTQKERAPAQDCGGEWPGLPRRRQCSWRG